MIHRINIFLLSLFIAFAPTYIFAGSVASEGWSVTKRLVQGATTFYDGTKNVVLNGKNYAAKGAAAITPAAGQVSKMIVGTGAVLAVDLAIKSLLGAVDYVMDPANNRVKYFVTGDPANPKDPSVKLYYQVSSNGVTKYFSSNLAAATDLCTRNAQGYGWILVSTTPATFAPDKTDYQYATCVIKRNSTAQNETFTWPYSQIINPAYDPNAEPNREEKYLPYDAVASQIISDAAAEKAEGKAYVSSVADTALEQDEQKQIVPATEVVSQLNQSQSIPTSNTSTGEATKDQTDPNTGETVKDTTDLKLEFPEFCGWAPTVCQAAQAAIEFPKTFLEKFTKWDDWINRETKAYTYDETKLNTEDKRNFDFSIFNTNRFSVDDKCPTPEPQTITVLGVTTSFSLSLQPVCSVLELAKPALVACSYIYAAYIVIGAAKGG
ncbi:virulence factor TspB C-terminal domain-related protein (plasmid) [Acinetobacter baumannii]